jgi:exodeoxyribonuclease VII large subunit
VARLAAPLDTRLAGARATLDTQAAALAALGPHATLERGYAIVRRVEDGLIVRDPAEAPAGTALALRVARGTFDALAGGVTDAGSLGSTDSSGGQA